MKRAAHHRWPAPCEAYCGAVRYEVTDADTATALGSGDVPVLATPRVIAWMEAATVLSAAPLLDEGQTTVGVAIRVEHLRATPVGGTVEVVADLKPGVDGRRHTFVVQAVDGSGAVVAAGEIDRAVVDRARFVEASRRQN